MSKANECPEEEEADCPLCLTPLEDYDRSHPIQCPSRSSHCHFNCCIDCLEHMIKATKDDHTKASDGNVFRVLLHCPNCRSNLGPSIRDTVLLRKVDKYGAFKHTDDSDEKLSASELRLKEALEKDEDVSSAIEGAQQREDEFFGRADESKDEQECFDPSELVQNMSGSSLGGRERIWSFDDEEGVEADLLGPHKSFIFRHHSQMKLSMEVDEEKKVDDVEADPTLLCGLSAFMTDQEEQFVTAQLISGDTTKLAVATEMMHYVAALSREGMRPSLKRRQSRLVRNPSIRTSMLSSIKEVIREGSEARRLEEERTAANAVGAVASQLAAKTMNTYGGVAGGRRNQKMMADMEVKKQMEYMKLHPLPLRMPKYAEATATTKLASSLTFLDDMWDGTVLDAFTKMTVNKSLLGGAKITKQHPESIGIRRVIDAGSSKPSKSNGRGYIDTSRPRVIVASINREMGQQGVAKGDVVTHFDGEEFKGTANELKEVINSKCEGEVMTFVFNADAAVAEALRRRSLISDKI